MKIKAHICMIFMAFLIANFAIAEECKPPIDIQELRIISEGTFMLSSDKGNAYVSSYLPSGTIVKPKSYKTINYHKRKDKPPIPQCHLYVETSLGKHGYVLLKTAQMASKYSGIYIFPRTEIEIYKKANFEKVNEYRLKNILKKEIFMSSICNFSISAGEELY